MKVLMIFHYELDMAGHNKIDLIEGILAHLVEVVES